MAVKPAPKSSAKKAAKASPKKASKNAGARRPKVKKTSSPAAVGQAMEALKKGFLMGLGATVQTAERLKELAAPVVEEIADSDARRAGADLTRVLLSEKAHFEARLKSLVDGFVRASIKSLNLATREELDALRRDLRAVSAKSAPPRSGPRGAKPPARSGSGASSGPGGAAKNTRSGKPPARPSSGGAKRPATDARRPKSGGPAAGAKRAPRAGKPPSSGFSRRPPQA